MPHKPLGVTVRMLQISAGRGRPKGEPKGAAWIDIPQGSPMR